MCLILTVAVLLLTGPVIADSAGAVPLELVRVVPGRAPVAGTSRVEVTLRNAGDAALADGTGLHLEATWHGPDGVPIHDWTADERSRYGFGGVVSPGATFAIEILLRAVDEGRHTLALDLVRGGEEKPLQTLTVEVVARGRATASALGLVALATLAVLAARHQAEREVARRSADVLRLAVALVPSVVVWAAAVVSQRMFSELTGLPLHAMAPRLILGSAALWALPILLVPFRFRGRVAAAVVAGLTLLTFADVVHQRAFGSIVSVASLSSAGQVPAVGESIAELTRAADAPLFLLLLSGILLLFLPRAGEPRRALDRGGRVACLAAVGLLAWPVPGEIDRTVKGFFGRNVYNPGAIVARLGLHSAHAFDLQRAWRERGLRGELTDADARGVIEYFRERAARRRRGPLFGVAAGHDLIIVQAEAVQEWVIGLEIEGVEVTPFLNTLAESELYFPNVLDQTREGNTSDAEYLVLNSQHPLPEGAIAFRREGNDFHTLAHVLAGRGYTSLSAHPGVPGFWNRAHLHPRYGFDRTLFADELGTGPVVGWGLADGPFLERMFDRLLDEPRPYFAFLVTMGLHHPFETFPDELKEMPLGYLEGSRLGNYLHGVRHFDSAMRALFGRLQGAGRLDRTVVAIYGDHDARLGMPRPLLRLLEAPWDPSLEVRLDRVPFFVAGPAGDLAGLRQTTGGQIDVAPTLLELLGIETPASFAGHSLLADRPALAVRVDGVVMDGERIFVPSGRQIPQGGACFNYPQGGMRPAADCEALKREGYVEASASIFLANHDLARQILESSK